MEGITKRNVVFILIFQTIVLLLFAIFTVYDKGEPDAIKYPMFQDVHVMIYIGFGFLMTFLKRYGFSSVGFNFLVAALTVQWAMLCDGFLHLNADHRMEIGLESLYKADIAAAAVLISMGAVLGRTSYMQLLVMALIEIVIFVANAYLGSAVFKVSDAGGSIFVHAFGAYFGLAASWALGSSDKTEEEDADSLESSSYSSDMFAMIGTIFLWVFWPSFNAIETTGDDQQRAIINTYLALTSCCVTAFAMSLVMSEEHKFDMVHVQNSTLAGGVAVGTSANLMIQPWGALIVGVLAGVLSVTGYSKLTPILRRKCGIKDTCGVHNLHGMPAVLAGLIGALMAGIASEQMYHASLYQIYPAMAGPQMTASPEFPYLAPGDGRTALEQAGFQAIALAVTLALAVIFGAITGFILNCTKKSSAPPDKSYDDDLWWGLPEDGKISTVGSGQYNPSFVSSLRRV